MTKRLINKNIDIYSYPNELENNLGSISLGDLHGNSIKLIHFLFRHKIIKFKQEVKNIEEAYQQFVAIYELYGDLVQEYLEIRTLLQFTQVKITNAKQKILSTDKELLLEKGNGPEHSQPFHLKKQAETNLQLAIANEVELEQKLSGLKERLSLCIEQFNQFMIKLEISDIKTAIRLIGDEVADRGNCDYFTLRILDFLYQNQVPMNIIFSNHGYEFIHAYEKLMVGQPFKPKGNIGDIQIKSFWGIQLLLEQGVISPNELTKLIDRTYKPTLKIMDYSLSKDGITLSSHAPIRFDSIRLVATYLGVSYDDSSKEALAATIDQMNNHFQVYIKSNKLHLLFENNEIKDLTNMTEEERVKWPLTYLIWNRWNESKETEDARPASHNGYYLTYVHGHDPFQSQLPYVYNLDTLCGKDSRKNEEEQANKAFQFLSENRYTNVDKTASEYLLRNILRYKVLDSDEHVLKVNASSKLPRSLEDTLDSKVNADLRKLSLLKKPDAASTPVSAERDFSTANKGVSGQITTSFHL